MEETKKEQTECKSEFSIKSPNEILNNTIASLTTDGKHITS